MKDIYELLKDVTVDMDEYDRIELSELEKKRVYGHILKNRKKSRHYLNRIAVAVIALCVVGIVVPVSAGVLAHINGNIKSNYKEEINETLVRKTEESDQADRNGEKQENQQGKDQDKVQIEVLNVGRMGRKINITCAFTLEEGAEDFYEDCHQFELSHSNTLLAEPFRNSYFLYDGGDTGKDFGPAGARGLILSHEGNIVIQKISIFEDDDEHLKEDHQITLHFEDLVIGGKVMKGEWECVCDVKASNYADTELVTYPINVEGYASLPYEQGGYERSIILDSYALTANGIVFYGTLNQITYYSDEHYEKRKEFPEQHNNLRLLLRDNLGNEYLMYGLCLESEEELDRKLDPSPDDFESEAAELAARDQEISLQMEFVLYDGPARLLEPGKNYLADWDPNATEITVVVQEIITVWDYHGGTPTDSYKNVSEEVTISLVGTTD